MRIKFKTNASAEAPIGGDDSKQPCCARKVNAGYVPRSDVKKQVKNGFFSNVIPRVVPNI